jgi:hypothetical protein
MGSFAVQPYLASGPTGAEERVTDHVNRFPRWKFCPTGLSFADTYSLYMVEQACS